MQPTWVTNITDYGAGKSLSDTIRKMQEDVYVNKQQTRMQYTLFTSHSTRYWYSTRLTENVVVNVLDNSSEKSQQISVISVLLYQLQSSSLRINVGCLISPMCVCTYVCIQHWSHDFSITKIKQIHNPSALNRRQLRTVSDGPRRSARQKVMPVVYGRGWFNAQLITGLTLWSIICANSIKILSKLHDLTIISMTLHDGEGDTLTMNTGC